ncbi:MAG: hypothetical protein F9K31_10185 [Dokdonella sp.]|nr:MAG: hypothetical protein F9K31_10185 [Dokdonella sp.]
MSLVFTGFVALLCLATGIALGVHVLVPWAGLVRAHERIAAALQAIAQKPPEGGMLVASAPRAAGGPAAPALDPARARAGAQSGSTTTAVP